MSISFNCSCGTRIRAADDAAGKRARCPGCNKPCVVPTPQPDPGPSATVRFSCACGKVLRASGDAAGKRAKCPECGAAVQVPGPPLARAATPAPDPIAPLREAVRSKDHDTRRKAVDELANIPEAGSTELLRSMTADRSPFVRVAAVRHLLARGACFTEPELGAFLGDRDSDVRELAIKEIGARKLAGFVDRLLSGLPRETISTVCVAISHALGEIGDPRAIEPLLNTLDHPECSRSGSIAALARFEGAALLKSLVGLLTAERPRIRASAFAILLRKGAAAVSALGEVVGTGDANHRSRVTWALAGLGEPSALPLLVAALDDTEASVRRAAVWGLARLRALGVQPDPAGEARCAAVAQEVRWAAATGMEGAYLSAPFAPGIEIDEADTALVSFVDPGPTRWAIQGWYRCKGCDTNIPCSVLVDPLAPELTHNDLLVCNQCSNPMMVRVLAPPVPGTRTLLLRFTPGPLTDTTFSNRTDFTVTDVVEHPEPIRKYLAARSVPGSFQELVTAAMKLAEETLRSWALLGLQRGQTQEPKMELAEQLLRSFGGGQPGGDARLRACLIRPARGSYVWLLGESFKPGMTLTAWLQLRGLVPGQKDGVRRVVRGSSRLPFAPSEEYMTGLRSAFALALSRHPSEVTATTIDLGNRDGFAVCGKCQDLYPVVGPPKGNAAAVCESCQKLTSQ